MKSFFAWFLGVIGLSNQPTAWASTGQLQEDISQKDTEHPSVIVVNKKTVMQLQTNNPYEDTLLLIRTMCNEFHAKAKRYPVEITLSPTRYEDIKKLPRKDFFICLDAQRNKYTAKYICGGIFAEVIVR